MTWDEILTVVSVQAAQCVWREEWGKGLLYVTRDDGWLQGVSEKDKAADDWRCELVAEGKVMERLIEMLVPQEIS